MPPSQLDVFDKLVEDYSKNPNQGIKFCQKKLQKAPSNSTYLLAQADFLQKLGRPQDALTLVDTIKASASEPLESGIIVSLQNIVRDCHEELVTHNGIGGPKLASFWKDLLDKTPKSGQKDVRGLMLVTALRTGYWDLPPQLFARLQREAPQNAKYHFAWIAMCQIQADNLPSGDKMASSLRMLASRSLKTIVDNSLAKKDTPKVLSSSADLRLLYQIYRRQGLLDDLVEILDNPTIGITSDVGKNDVEFVTVKMNALEELKRWKELRAYCIGGIEQLVKHYEVTKRITQDVPNEIAWAVAWQPWKTALNATLEDPSSGSAQEVLTLAQRYLEIDPHHRNAGNAVLLYRFLFDQSKLLESCKTFFEAHSTRVSCFDDIKQVAEGLESEQRRQFLQFLGQCMERSDDAIDSKTAARQATSMINSLKLRYLLYISHMESRSDAEVSSFIAQCLEIYKPVSELTDGPGDDACILAITTLMKYGSIKSNNYNLQAACLAQLLIDNSQHNFQASLLQLLNARILGLGSLAVAAFRDLHVQEVQNDTLSHILYTRLSNLHPWPVSLRNVQALDERFKDPKSSILHALQYPRRGTDAVTKTLTKDLENVFFDKLYEFLDFEKRLEKSFSTAQYKLELARIRRLTDDVKTLNSVPSGYDLILSDNRDFGAIVNFEPATSPQSFQVIATGGYKPSTYWIARFEIHEIVQSLLTTRGALTESQNRTIDNLFKYLDSHGSLQDTELTPAEREICARWNKLIPIAFWLILGPNHQRASKEQSIKQDFASLAEYLSTATLAIQAEDLDLGADDDRLEFTHVIELEKWYLSLELAKACSLLVAAAFVVAKQKGHHSAKFVTANELNKIKTEAKNLSDAVQKQARTLQANLKKEGQAKVLQVVKSGALGGVIEQLVGENELRIYVQEIVESAVEGLDGVLKVKMT